MANSSGWERLVDNVLKGFGHLDCIFCLPRSDKMYGIMDIGWRKFGWMTTNGLLELRMLFRAKPGYGRGVDTSSGWNRASRFACVKQREDSALLGKREGSHDDSGWE
jgi:hypothetical protein